jgi:hypothetical protein
LASHILSYKAEEEAQGSGGCQDDSGTKEDKKKLKAGKRTVEGKRL